MQSRGNTSFLQASYFAFRNDPSALDKLIDQQVIEPVTYSDWEAPIVPLLKKDKKTLRLCGDFSGGILRRHIDHIRPITLLQRQTLLYHLLIGTL